MPRFSVGRLATSIVLLTLLSGSVLSAQDQVLYVTQLTAGLPSVAAYDLNTLQPVDVGTALTASRAVGNGHFYGGLGTDSSGNVYVAAPNGYVYKYDDTGAAVTSFGTGGFFYAGYNSIVTGGTVNPSGTQLVLAYNLYTSAAYAFSTSTGNPVAGFTAATVASGQPWSVAFNPSGTFFYATNGGTGTPSAITQFSLTGGAGTALTVTSSPGGLGLSNARGLAFQSDNTFLVTDTAQDYLVRYMISGSSVGLDTSFGTNGYVSVAGLKGGITVDSSGDIYVLTDNGTVSNIEKFSPNGSLLNNALLTLTSSGGYASYVGSLAIGSAAAAIPEPSTFALLTGLLSLGTLSLSRSRRRKE